MSEEIRASRLIGMPVRTAEGRFIGAFSDFMFFPETCGIPLAIVSYGGIAGFREKRRSIRFRCVSFRPEVPFLKLRINWEEWKQTPEFGFSAPSAQDVRNILADMPEVSSETGDEGQFSTATDGSDGVFGDSRDRWEGVVWGEADGSEKSVPCAASVTFGMVAVGIDDKRIGVMRDFVIDMELGIIRRLVLAFGGVFGFGSETRSVGAKGLEVDFEFDQVRLPFAGKDLLGGKLRGT